MDDAAAEPIPPLMPVFPQPVPDEARLRWTLAGGWAMVFVSILLAVVAVILIAIVAFRLVRENQYNSEGQTADAKILDKRVQTRTNRGSRSSTYYVTYSFVDAAGTSRQQDEDVPSDLYDRLQVGDSHPVQYLPADPTVNRLSISRSRTYVWLMPAIAVLLAGLAGLMFFGNRKAGRRRAGVVFHGQARPGQIVVSEPRGRGKSRRY